MRLEAFAFIFYLLFCVISRLFHWWDKTNSCVLTARKVTFFFTLTAERTIGLDGINPRILQELADDITKPLHF